MARPLKNPDGLYTKKYIVENGYKCPKCDVVEPSKKYLRDHIKEKHAY